MEVWNNEDLYDPSRGNEERKMMEGEGEESRWEKAEEEEQKEEEEEEEEEEKKEKKENKEKKEVE